MKPGPRLDLRKPLEQRFWPKVDIRDPAECWEWTGAKRNGYGAITLGGHSGSVVGAHTVTYRWAFGEIPPGLEIDHLCRNRACVNPLHLEAVTPVENRRRSPIVGRHTNRNPRRGDRTPERTHCANGHEFTAATTYHYRGRRLCRVCNQEAQRRRKQRLLDRMIDAGKVAA